MLENAKPHFETVEIYPWLYRIEDKLDVYFYLLVGTEKALLFDTGFGYGDIKNEIRNITDLPLTVILGHGHIDHANGAYQFEEVFMSAKDQAVFDHHTSPLYRDNVKEMGRLAGMQPQCNDWVNQKALKITDIDPGTVKNLGGLSAEIIEMAGHTQGSIGIYVPEKKLLLTSDAINSHLWLFLDESGKRSEYLAMVDSVLDLDFDEFFHAHSGDKHSKDDMRRFQQVAKNATLEKSQPYHRLEGFEAYIYEEDGVAFVFNKGTLD